MKLPLKLTASIFVLLCAAAHSNAQAVQSLYSDLTGAKCKSVASSGESGGEWSTTRCPGAAGFQLVVHDDDSRQSVTVVRPDGTEHPLELWQTVSGAFSTVGQRAEWRVRRGGGKDEPLALIVRFNYQASPDTPDKNVSSLVVAKIIPGTICVTDVIRPGADANERARRAADSSASRPCRRGE